MEQDSDVGITRSHLVALATRLLQHYQVTQPPVPIERMLQTPPPGLKQLNPDQISAIIEHGLYNYAPRLAMARLLCRKIVESDVLRTTWPADTALSYSDIKFFARCLLMPQSWMETLANQALSIDHISSYLQVPTFAVVTRLAELKLPIPNSRPPAQRATS